MSMVGNPTAAATAAMNVAVIGAGAAGLAAARALTRSGIKSVTVLEKDADPGGVWRYTKEDETRPMYRGLRTNLPRELMAFREKPWGGDKVGRSYVTHGEVQNYLKEYATDHSLTDHISYGCTVTQLTLDSSSSPSSSSSSSPSATTPKITLRWHDVTSSQDHIKSFDAVCVCNGHYALPSFPSIPGIEYFKGDLKHSVAYDDPSFFEGKRVLCVGGRASGSDLAREISFFADRVYLSDSGFDNTGESGGGEPRVRENVFLVSKTTEVDEKGGVHFDKSTLVVGDLDVIIFCSGYDYVFPFINEKSNLDLSVVPGERRVTPLYEQLWHARYPNLTFFGLQHSVVPFPYFELQAEAVAAHMTGTAPRHFPPLEERLNAADRDATSGGPKDGPGRVQDTHYLGGYQWDYCRKMAKMAGSYDDDVEKYIATNKAIYEHSGSERGAIFPGGPDDYRYTCYVRDNENVAFESFKV